MEFSDQEKKGRTSCDMVPLSYRDMLDYMAIFFIYDPELGYFLFEDVNDNSRRFDRLWFSTFLHISKQKRKKGNFHEMKGELKGKGGGGTLNERQIFRQKTLANL